MSTYFVQGSTMDAIAEAINQKAGTQAAMTPAQMVTAIGAISGGSGNTLESDFLTIYKETVEVGENSVANSQQYHNYLNSIKSIPGNLFAMSIHKKASYTYDEWANGTAVSGNSGYRYRNTWQSSQWGIAGFDAVAPVGTLVDVYTVELKNPNNA